nr:LAGLIDADG family homing endonuclease [Halomicroarcula sp. SYNS111]
MVRKATDVRPKVLTAAFECQRCGTLTRIPQAAGDFQEPHECQGCERQGPFRLNTDQSEFIDAQKIRVQESPEGLRGGETPQSIDVNIEDDITGNVTAGDHVRVTGVLKLDQQGNDREKSPMFDIYMDGVSVEIEDEQFEEMEITEEDKKEIVELSNEPDLYDKMVGAIAPSIYGYEKEKLAMMIQLFSGVTKSLPDGSRIRGDLHMLLIGDPGTGKCQKFDSKVALADGTERQIGDLVESRLDAPTSIDDGVYQQTDFEVQTVDDDGSITTGTATKVWKREAPETLYEIRTQSGREVTVTPSHPLFVQSEMSLSARRADQLSEGDFLAVPGQLRGEWDNTLEVHHRTVDRHNANSLTTPEQVTPPLARLMGYVIAEGHINATESSGDVTVTNADEEIIEDVLECVESLGLRATRRPHHTNEDVELACCSSVELIDFFREIEPAMLEPSAEQRVPECLFRATPANKRAFLRAYIDSEGTVSKKEREIAVGSMSRELLEGVQTLLLTFGITSHFESRQGGSYRLRISGTDFVTFVDQVGFVTERKSTASASFYETPQNSNTAIVPNLSTDLKRIRESLALSQFECGIPRTTYQHYERGDRNPSRDSLLEVVATFEQRLEWLRETKDRITGGEWTDIEDIRAQLNLSQDDLATAMGVEQTAVSYYERNDAIPDGGCVEDAKEAVIRRIDRGLSVTTDVKRLRTIATADVAWDRIESIEPVKSDEEWVYDLEVEGTHSYLSNGIVSHNSQMLSYIRQIAPRSVYTSGKGSSSAGLTAAAVRDDFGDGQQWTLEAGALVLADQGIAAVDELDKMRCVTGDTLVHRADGISRIRDLAHDAAATGTVEDLANGRTIREFGDLRVWTMTDDGRLVTRPVTAIHEYDAPDELTRVTLTTGERLTATADHPFFVRADGERRERHAADLEHGDWVYVPRDLNEPAADGGVAALPDGDSPTPPDGDAVSPAMASVLGYLAGDGNVYYDREEGVYGIRFTNAEAELLADFEGACRSAFDAEPVRPPSEQRADGVETVRLPGKQYADTVLDAGMNLETYDGKRLPGSVTASSRTAKAAFVRALADSEGSVDERNVRLHSSSYELMLGTKQLLLELGVSSQLQTRKRSDRRDVYTLTITDADSLAAFDRHVGFTLDRKQRSLDDVLETVAGDRTVLDVIPGCGSVLADCRASLRLHQSECGLSDATYCNFENEDANVSLRCARTVLERFETRRHEATVDRERLEGADWDRLESLRQRYHVSQAELAAGTAYSQQQISSGWGEDAALRSTVESRLDAILSGIASTDLERLRDRVHGDVKWRRVDSVETVPATVDDDRIRLLREELAELLSCPPDDAVDVARQRLAEDPSLDDWATLRSRLDEYGISGAALAADVGVDQSTVSRWLRGVVETDRFDEVRRAARDRIDAVRDQLRSRLDELESRQAPSVYDLTVAGTHNFVANGMVVHNSEDRSAMHQALEQQEISVSKAGINATLKSRCSLLGAANPKYGRFDQYEPIGEQIDLEPALISRFDLIFTVTDQPDEESDRNLASHIIQTNYAGELHTHRTENATSNFTEEEVETVTEEVAPTIEPDLLRKYIAYAKRNCFPTMTEEAKERIEDFYVDLRLKGQDEDAPVPVTARKLEALVRLAEASARIRLSDTVEEDDAERAVDIALYCMKQIGIDPETGEFDADVVETGTSKSQRDRIQNLKGIIADIEDEYDEGAPIDIVVERAEEVGIDESKAEHEIEKLKQKGEVYEPRTDHLRTT